MQARWQPRDDHEYENFVKQPILLRMNLFVLQMDFGPHVTFISGALQPFCLLKGSVKAIGSADQAGGMMPITYWHNRNQWQWQVGSAPGNPVLPGRVCCKDRPGGRQHQLHPFWLDKAEVGGHVL
jgi:hypothetical protein